MYVVYLTGGTGSGKSTVARELELRGATRLDLDDLAREVTETGSPALPKLAVLFGDDVLDPVTGALRRDVLAQRVFATEEARLALEAVTHPAIRHLFLERLDSCATDVVVVEIPLLDRVEDLLRLADEIVFVRCPLPLRRERAIARGMDAADFDARLLHQPTDSYLSDLADTTFENEGDEHALVAQVSAWWQAREAQGFERARG